MKRMNGVKTIMMMDITVINSNSIDDYTILAILGALCIPLEINIRLMYSLKTSRDFHNHNKPASNLAAASEEVK